MKPREVGCHAIIIGGGSDVDPKHYGEEHLKIPDMPKRAPFRIRLRYVASVILYPILLIVRKILSARGSKEDHDRDAFELDILDRAVKAGLPVLGICRGSQLMNIYFGGSLHQDIEGFYTEIPTIRTIFPRKRVMLEAGTHLEEILACEECPVNALHSQAVDRLGENMIVAARDEAGVIQAIEHAASPFLIGVQWHPEYLPQLDDQCRIFERMVNYAKGFEPITAHLPVGKSRSSETVHTSFTR